jgi:hypothetical protein
MNLAARRPPQALGVGGSGIGGTGGGPPGWGSGMGWGFGPGIGSDMGTAATRRAALGNRRLPP